ncbi:putative hAT family C-terminal dimerization region-containing protein 11 [Homarus americanus]|uniref:Putative hAT family C-terminal dimerization region-containing protein 11 n=1 Tax=Homarus americanus TaxID=6706 RepID=A0A8J5K5J9_HOMAM|nr:putative hAT family C-terminal dimerization region-containing protein 11 [Homarus americanus]
MVFDDAATITRIDFQWKKVHRIKWIEASDTLFLWAEMSYRDATGENLTRISQLALTLLSLPHSNADVERIFSHMNIVQIKLRNRLSIRSLNAIMAIKYGP